MSRSYNKASNNRPVNFTLPGTSIRFTVFLADKPVIIKSVNYRTGLHTSDFDMDDVISYINRKIIFRQWVRNYRDQTKKRSINKRFDWKRDQDFMDVMEQREELCMVDYIGDDDDVITDWDFN